jgi:hypothetical protein
MGSHYSSADIGSVIVAIIDISTPNVQRAILGAVIAVVITRIPIPIAAIVVIPVGTVAMTTFNIGCPTTHQEYPGTENPADQ